MAMNVIQSVVLLALFRAGTANSVSLDELVGRALAKNPAITAAKEKVAEAESHRAEDATLRQKIDARNELDSAAYRVGRRLAELGDSVPVHVKARADGLVSDARAALDEDASPERIRALTDELQQVYHSLGSGQADPDDRAGSGPPPAPAADDDVVDAEFTVS